MDTFKGAWVGEAAGTPVYEEVLGLVDALRTASTPLEFWFKPTRVLQRVGGLYVDMEGEMLGRRERFVIFFTMDRRQARRVARRTGRRFRWKDGEAKWR